MLACFCNMRSRVLSSLVFLSHFIFINYQQFLGLCWKKIITTSVEPSSLSRQLKTLGGSLSCTAAVWNQPLVSVSQCSEMLFAFSQIYPYLYLKLPILSKKETSFFYERLISTKWLIHKYEIVVQFMLNSLQFKIIFSFDERKMKNCFSTYK